MSNQGLGLPMPDVETSAYSVECKHKAKLPGWLTSAVNQAHRNASAGKLPLVVLHQSGQRHDLDLVVVRMGEFIEWFGSPVWESIATSDRVAGGAADKEGQR